MSPERPRLAACLALALGLPGRHERITAARVCLSRRTALLGALAILTLLDKVGHLFLSMNGYTDIKNIKSVEN
jgi:hypothetical protein